MMMTHLKRFAFATLAIALCFGATAQKKTEQEKEEREERREMIQKQKEEYCTKHAGLSAEEAKSYWQLRSALDEQKKSLKKEGRKLKDLDLDEADEATIASALKANAEAKVRIEDMEVEYIDQFIEAIGARKVALVKRAERNFKRDVLKELRGSDMEQARPRDTEEKK